MIRLAKHFKILPAALFASLLTSTAQADVISGGVTGGTAFAAGGTFLELSVPLGNPVGPPRVRQGKSTLILCDFEQRV